MKKVTYYATKESFEIKHPYVSVVFSEYQPAAVEGSFTSKKNAQTAQDNRKIYGTILTRKQAVKEIADWNAKNKFN